MISMLKGRLAVNGGRYAVIECGGVGYYVHIPICVSRALPAIEEVCSLHTILSISKTDVALIGFLTPEQRECYLMLTGVAGAGTKAGLEILGALDVQGVQQAIASENVEMLTQVKGIGKKLAQRIILECRDKVAEKASLLGTAASMETSGSAAPCAVEALVSLGYKPKEALAAVADIDASLPLEAMIAQALRKI